MKRSLAKYKEMRDFDVTEEPSGAVHRSDSGRSFVIQKHAATALHYDFRLELDGVLLSWAVPKGPSLSPKDKRLAVQVEDHPVDYRDFEGTIPKGEYGGGAVIVWDRGTWEPIGDPHEALEKGRLEVVLHGEKVHGKYMLVRLADKKDESVAARKKKPSWLLVKRADEHAREGASARIVERTPRSVLTGRTIEDVERGVPAKKRTAKKKTAKKKTAKTAAALPAFGKVAVQLARLVDEVPTRGDWVYEIKYDGYRAIATLDDGAVRIASRSGQEWSDRFPAVAEALSHVRAKTAVFDGEIAYVMEDGRTDFQRLQNALSRPRDAQRLIYFVFDLLHYDGVDLTSEPLEERKAKLRTILAGEGPPLKMGDHVRGAGPAFFEEVCKLGLEGIIAKRADRPYQPGRGPDWVKVKCHKRQELAIVGFTPPKGQRTGLGALLLGVREGSTYRYAGKVGTGFTQASLVDLVKRLTPLEVKEPRVEGAPRMRNARWVRPELVAEVRFSEWTKGGALRHPSFEGLRQDKKARDARRERPAKLREVADPLAGVVVTHPERVLDKESGTTKGELVAYAGAIAEHLFPYAERRPLMMLRCTDAWDGSGALQGRKRQKACFVQKHMGRGITAQLGQGVVDGEEVLFVTKPQHIVELAQFNAIELHGWGSRMPRYDQPDWIVLDLDPDVGLPFARVVEAALDLHEQLAKMGLASFVKTTGGKGLHVVVPLTPKDDWTIVRAFAEAVAKGMVSREPRRFVATMTKAARTGKIFIDHFRNGRGATAILPYSPRARGGVPVAMPVAWEDLPTIDPADFTVRTVPALLADRREDPWADLLTTKQTIPRDLAARLEADS